MLKSNNFHYKTFITKNNLNNELKCGKRKRKNCEKRLTNYSQMLVNLLKCL